MWMFNGYGMGTGGWLLMALFWVLLVAVIVFAIVKLFPGRGHGPAVQTASFETPRQLLDRRLASGEIGLEDHERLSARLAPPTQTQRS